jgi:hypothetical protein
MSYTFHINKEFTDEEMGAIIRALDFFMYNFPHMTEELYDTAASAMNKILSDVE